MMPVNAISGVVRGKTAVIIDPAHPVVKRAHMRGTNTADKCNVYMRKTFKSN